MSQYVVNSEFEIPIKSKVFHLIFLSSNYD